jgi:RNA polymerase sigma-70 factor (ECF subfamily)
MAPSLAWTLGRRPQAGWNVIVVRPDTGRAGSAAYGDLDESGLVRACLDGRAEAFDVIVERHRRTVYQLCYRFVGNHEDASDLTQEVFLRAYRGLKNFRGQASFSTWLYRIGVNVCLNRVSAKAPRSEPIEERHDLAVTSDAPPDIMIREERACRVRSAVARLPRKQRAALVLRVYHEMSHQEIAETLGSSVGAVKANVFHALQNLKKLLGEEEL